MNFKLSSFVPLSQIIPDSNVRYIRRSTVKGRTIWIADAHRDDGKRFVVRADEKLTAFVELESAILSQNSAQAV
jgi:hypothetical protein